MLKDMIIKPIMNGRYKPMRRNYSRYIGPRMNVLQDNLYIWSGGKIIIDRPERRSFNQLDQLKCNLDYFEYLKAVNQ